MFDHIRTSHVIDVLNIFSHERPGTRSKKNKHPLMFCNIAAWYYVSNDFLLSTRTIPSTQGVSVTSWCAVNIRKNCKKIKEWKFLWAGDFSIKSSQQGVCSVPYIYGICAASFTKLIVSVTKCINSTALQVWIYHKLRTSLNSKLVYQDSSHLMR